MSVMRAPEVPEIWAQDRIFTVEDLEDMPDDEFRYELDDGMLIVSPAPSCRIRSLSCDSPSS
ncbi:MAG TPA: hypothetical protein VGI05_19855 [Streptosporangiaceae bacterium]